MNELFGKKNTSGLRNGDGRCSKMLQEQSPQLALTLECPLHNLRSQSHGCIDDGISMLLYRQLEQSLSATSYCRRSRKYSGHIICIQVLLTTPRSPVRVLRQASPRFVPILRKAGLYNSGIMLSQPLRRSLFYPLDTAFNIMATLTLIALFCIAHLCRIDLRINLRLGEVLFWQPSCNHRRRN